MTGSESIKNLASQLGNAKIEAFDEITEKARMAKYLKSELTSAKSIICSICNKLGCKPEDLDSSIEKLINANKKTS